ncbi:MAG: hypothetical protein UZ01_02527 [Candidatus Brocadia sinica]|nr:MAG: hypothetical protein UZ01_02527 [Candidatus Brocadia sinica]
MVKKSNLVIIRDTREQKPLVFPNAKVKDAKLQTGDYSLEHFEDKITIERKSLSDLLQSLSAERKRFMSEVQRMRAFEYAGLVVEASLADIYRGVWRNAISVGSVVGSLQALSAKHGLHVLFACDRAIAALMVEGILYHFLRKQHDHWERIKNLLGGIT